MKKIYEFTGLSKRDKNELIRDYMKCEWKNILLSYIFISLSSSKPFFSSKNIAVFVLIWYTLSILLSIYAYVSQNDYLKSKRRAKKYSKNHKYIQVEKGSNFIPQIGGWNFIGIQLLVTMLFYIIIVPVVIYLQFNDFEIYKKDYMNLFLGIFADTYIVSLLYIIIGLLVNFIYDCEKDGTKLKKAVFSLKPKDILVYVVAIIIVIMAFIYYFTREFEGLCGHISRRIMGSIYIIVMIYPLIKCLMQVRSRKKKVHK